MSQPPQGPPVFAGPHTPAAPPRPHHHPGRPGPGSPTGAYGQPGPNPAAHLASAGTGAWGPYPLPAPQPPPQRGGTSLWLTAGGSALVAAFSLLACVTLMTTTLSGGSEAQASGKPRREVLYEDNWFHTAKGITVDAASHPFYNLAAPSPVDCDIPDFDPSSAAEWETFTDTIGPCLNEMWLAPLEEMGLRPEEPHYVIMDELPPELRGESEEEGFTLAYYMEHDLSITILVPSVKRLLPYPNMDDERIWFALVAHEYGHHVQGETGLLDAAYDLERDAGSQAEQLRVGRQIELQAECLAGTGTAVVDDHDADDVAFVNRNFNEDTGDSDTHGSADNRVHWFNSGATGETMQACNTFDSEAALIR
ncbi:neutral zinc metallopeptidase [Thermobifida halotolerans]|uniref:Neutral zinc metallopeptidase n=1 Tax=Thermobifida halotolerans TaxID=483545 RepID=A0AA97M5Z0_9ACTN|nr:neutral zinc metallopeptidase [Thermobifida halotolerans]UOE21698.1 neutral zinc metallopeptidase [Thermobifida halotolerans]